MNIITKEDEDLMREVIAETLGIPVAEVTAAHAGHLALNHMEPGAHCLWRRRPDDRVAGIRDTRVREAGILPLAEVVSLAIGVEEPRPEFERRYTTQADIDRGETRVYRCWAPEVLYWNASGFLDAQPITRAQGLRIVRAFWIAAGVALSLIGLGELLGRVASR